MAYNIIDSYCHVYYNIYKYIIINIYNKTIHPSITLHDMRMRIHKSED